MERALLFGKFLNYFICVRRQLLGIETSKRFFVSQIVSGLYLGSIQISSSHLEVVISGFTRRYSVKCAINE